MKIPRSVFGIYLFIFGFMLATQLSTRIVPKNFVPNDAWTFISVVGGIGSLLGNRAAP